MHARRRPSSGPSKSPSSWVSSSRAARVSLHRVWQAALLALVLSGPGSSFAQAQPAKPGAAPPAALVRVAPVETQSVGESIELSGTVRAMRQAVVAAQTAGVVARRAVDQGERVKAGQVLLSLDDTLLQADLQGVNARLEEARARLNLAQLELDRARGLVERDAVARRRLETAEAELLVQQARTRQLEAERSRIKTDLERCVVTAPFGGSILRLDTELGAWVARGGPVLELADLSTVEVVIELPEAWFARVRVGALARLRFDALPGRSFEGRVQAIVGQADARAHTLPVIIRLANPDRLLAVGMMARARLSFSDESPALLVPRDAILQQGSRYTVFVVRDGVAKQVVVELGRGQGDRTEVTGELRAGEAVVVRGNERLRPDAPVQLEPAQPQPAQLEPAQLPPAQLQPAGGAGGKP